MECIVTVYQCILQFASIVSSSFRDEAPMSSDDFDNLEKCRKRYRNYTKFLYAVLTHLSARGSSFSHIQDLIMRLNYNNFYYVGA